MDETILDQTSEDQVIEWHYAGFWIRFLAYLIDVLIIWAATFIVGVLIGVIQYVALGEINANPGYGLRLVTSIAAGLYFPFMESSKFQATLGKHILGLKVCDALQGRLGFRHALGRHLAKLLSSIILFIGFIMIGFDDHKQGLHDKLAHTYIIYSK